MGRESRCWRCGETVQWRNLNGVPVGIDRVAPGTGDIVIQRALDGSEIAVVMAGGSYRRHSAVCRSPSFVSTALRRKQRPEA